MKPHALISLAILAGCSAAQAQVYCRIATWFNPSGTFSRPFSNVGGALCAAPNNGTATIYTGDYYETGIYSAPGPRTLTTTSGPVRIGVAGRARTTLKVISYNTHLYGESNQFYSRWADTARSQGLIQFLAAQRAAGVDLVGLQDLFDDDLIYNVWYAQSFPAGNAGNGRRSGAAYGSGLSTFSNTAGTNNAQALYSSVNASDAQVSRSYFRQTFTKDSFGIGLFNTSLQRGTSSQEVSTRATQIQLLANGVLAYRQANPTHVVVITGSFNANDTSTEYTSTMSNQLGGVSGAADIAPNLAYVGAGVSQCTSCGTNELRTAFGGPTNVRNDFILYADSWDGGTRIVPNSYEVLRPTSTAPISAQGYNADTQSSFNLTSSQLSDHEALLASFDLVRR